jgi:hypothetical protein
VKQEGNQPWRCLLVKDCRNQAASLEVAPTATSASVTPAAEPQAELEGKPELNQGEVSEESRYSRSEMTQLLRQNESRCC